MISHSDHNRKRIVVASDSDRLSKAIKANLERRLDAQVARIDVNSERVRKDGALGDFHLIIVAISSSASEPTVILAKASLAHRIGQIPILIISDRPFEPDTENRILHLDFPFDGGQLHTTVSTILGLDLSFSPNPTVHSALKEARC